MRKLIILFMAIMLCGCASEKKTEEKQTQYKDGSYTTTAMGYGGEFEVVTTLKNDQLQDVVIKEHNETPSIGGVALEQMIEMMKEKNHYDVDTISGATKSSQALKEAVEKAYEEAKNES